MAASNTAMIRNEAASTYSAAAIPNWPISTPASAAPPTEASAKPRFISAFPSRSRPAGCSTAATAPRVSPRPVIASVPSTSAEREHQREQRVALRDQPESGEHERLEDVQRRQHAPERELVHAAP